MKHGPVDAPRFFFATAPMPCPYIAGRVESRLVSELAGPDAGAQHDRLSSAGFRRSHGIIYAPACPACSACKAVRMRAAEFSPGRSQRLIIRRNADLAVSVKPPKATDEQFALFRAYQNARHPGGDMSRMNAADFRALVEETPVETFVTEFRSGGDGRLLAVCLTDKTAGGFSAVYSFYDPDPALNRRSLGAWMIIWLAQRARDAGLAYVYLGYWIKDCAKMGYKAGFRPLEVRTHAGWRLLEDVEAEDADKAKNAAGGTGGLSPLSASESPRPAAGWPRPMRP